HPTEKLYQCYGPGKNPYVAIREVSNFWKQIKSRDPSFWIAPQGLFWLCHKKAYSALPANWKGSCALGLIQPGFFLLPEGEGGHLGTPL
ncbi:ENR1 protein, partial [Notiomystis cincta]|nr:ENR1 protein [Notiomystis cincta]